VSNETIIQSSMVMEEVALANRMTQVPLCRKAYSPVWLPHFMKRNVNDVMNSAFAGKAVQLTLHPCDQKLKQSDEKRRALNTFARFLR
jgi:hypothetical protein